MQYLHQIKLAYVMLKVNYCYIKSQLDYCNAIFFSSSKIMSEELPFTSILVWMYPHYWNSCIGYLWRRGLSTNEQLGHIIILTAAFLLTFLSLIGCDSSRKEVNMGKAFRCFFFTCLTCSVHSPFATRHHKFQILFHHVPLTLIL